MGGPAWIILGLGVGIGAIFTGVLAIIRYYDIKNGNISEEALRLVDRGPSQDLVPKMVEEVTKPVIDVLSTGAKVAIGVGGAAVAVGLASSITLAAMRESDKRKINECNNPQRGDKEYLRLDLDDKYVGLKEKYS